MAGRNGSTVTGEKASRTQFGNAGQGSDDVMPAARKRSKSRFEETYSIVPESLSNAAGAGQLANAEPLVRELNRVYQLANGVGAILQIISANAVIEDSYDEDDPESEMPLSKYTTGCLLTLATHVSQGIADEAWKTVEWAEKYGRKGGAK